MKTLLQKGELIKHCILQLCQVSEATYTDMVYRTGQDYAQKVSVTDEMSQALLSSKVFWKFYRNQFILIDQALIQKPEVPDQVEFLVYKGYDGIGKISLYEYWVILHNPKNLVAFPGKIVWDDVEAKIIGQVIDEVMKGESK